MTPFRIRICCSNPKVGKFKEYLDLDRKVKWIQVVQRDPILHLMQEEYRESDNVKSSLLIYFQAKKLGWEEEVGTSLKNIRSSLFSGEVDIIIRKARTDVRARAASEVQEFLMSLRSEEGAQTARMRRGSSVAPELSESELSARRQRSGSVQPGTSGSVKRVRWARNVNNNEGSTASMNRKVKLEAAEQSDDESDVEILNQLDQSDRMESKPINSYNVGALRERIVKMSDDDLLQLVEGFQIFTKDSITTMKNSVENPPLARFLTGCIQPDTI